MAFAVEDGDVGLADGDLVARQIGAQGLDVAERDDQHDRQAEPPQGESGQGWAPPPDNGRAPFDRYGGLLLSTERVGRTALALLDGAAFAERPGFAARLTPLDGRIPLADTSVSRALARLLCQLRPRER